MGSLNEVAYPASATSESARSHLHHPEGHLSWPLAKPIEATAATLTQAARFHPDVLVSSIDKVFVQGRPREPAVVRAWILGKFWGSLSASDWELSRGQEDVTEFGRTRSALA